MSGREVVRHDPHTSRRPDGFARWFAVCSCGWTRAGGGKLSAERLVDLHRRLNPDPKDAA